MVLHKRLDYGSSGYHVPPMPRVPRSARGKRSPRKKIEDKQISAFDLLATVAGELLSEREKIPFLNPIDASSSIKKELQENWRPTKAEVFDQGSCNESTLGSEILSKRPIQSPKPIEKDGKRSDFEGPNAAEIKTPLQTEWRMGGNLIDVNIPEEILEDPMDLDVKPPALVSSDSSVEVPISHNGKRLVVDRDDDENSSGCTHPNTNVSKAFRAQRIGDRRIRKLLASRYWKVPQTALKDGEFSNTDVEMKSVLRNRKMCYTRQRTQRSSFKRRKLFERHSLDGENFGEAVSCSPKLGGIKIEASDASASPNGAMPANGASFCTSGQKSYGSGDYHVKLRIKSFKVPELFIEIPETATVGSLKRTVMEAVTAILAGGLRVGVLLQGKKVRDDKQTLLQAGISRNDRTDNLGFTLEPNSTQNTPLLTCPEDQNSLILPSNPCLPCPPIEPIQRIPVIAPAMDQVSMVVPMVAAPEPPPQALNGPESDHDSVYSPDSKADKASESKAVVPVPAMNVDALAVVPLRKSRRSELVQRRIRRPFSVAEVEALVQAVEKLGTGRWRDVKIRAFDNAKHRTYVDLKDKWKTLVHTARISPQQRRGEPVPQELLDRVLSAHAYWSQQQAKLQLKPTTSHPDPTSLLI